MIPTAGNLSVESLSSLQHIIFDGVGLQDISIFLSILSCVKPDLERIYLDMKGYDPKDLDHPNWQILEDYFSKDVFTKTFLSFSFSILGVMIGRDEDRTAEVLQRLPMLRARISFHPM